MESPLSCSIHYFPFLAQFLLIFSIRLFQKVFLFPHFERQTQIKDTWWCEEVFLLTRLAVACSIQCVQMGNTQAIWGNSTRCPFNLLVLNAI